MTETTAVDTRTETVLAYAEVQDSLDHGAVAALLRALVAERDNALVMVANADELLQIKEKELLKLATALLKAQSDEAEAQADAACEHKGGILHGPPQVDEDSINRDIICADCHRIIGTQSENTAPRRPKGQKRKA